MENDIIEFLRLRLLPNLLMNCIIYLLYIDCINKTNRRIQKF